MSKDDRVYGTRANEIDPFFKTKRVWSTVKDKILKDYITCYLKTIQGRGQSIMIIDAFSGPGRFGDGSEGSPLIICGAIEKAPKRGVAIGCLFSDTHPAHRDALEGCLENHIKQGITEKPLADFSQALSRALEVGRRATLFFYLDPYGIKDLDFEIVKQIYERDTTQSTEVLINFNFKTFMRMSGNWSYADSASEVVPGLTVRRTDKFNLFSKGEYGGP
jgi:three-Cys-motif partner protein